MPAARKPIRRRHPSRRATTHSHDVGVIGGGIMGSACAWKLAEAGASVLVLEKSVPGAEASSAAAGILGACAEAHGPGPMADLLLASAARYPDWSEALEQATGLDVEYRRSGVLQVETTERGLRRAERRVEWMRGTERRFDVLGSRAVGRLEPRLAPRAGAVHFPNDARVDPKRLFRAVHIAAERAGARFESGAQVDRVVAARNRIEGVALENGETRRAPAVVVAAGSWSCQVRGTHLPKDAVIPARGQMVELETPAPPLRHVVFGGGVYLVPRDDGRVLVGSTIEFVGYRREVTARAVRDLLAGAMALAPDLANATVGASWSNFRPYTKTELPIVGRSSVRGLLYATGHFRNGILLAPITAEVVAALAGEKKPPLDPAPFELR